MKRRKFLRLFARTTTFAIGFPAARRALDSMMKSSLGRRTAAGQGATFAPALIASTREALVSHVTVTNAGGSDKVNELVYFGFPLGASEAPAGTTLAVYDDDGFGGKGAPLSNFQIDNFASDLSNNRRFCSIAGIVPNLGAKATRVLQVWRRSTAPPAGTAITTANLLALGGMANGGIVVNQTIAGTTYVARLSDALIGRTSFSKTAACNHGNWRSGPCMTEFIVSIPMSVGGVPHSGGDGLRCEFHVKAWKASVAAVSVENPILGLRVDIVGRNGHRSVQSQFTVENGSIQRMSSLSNPALVSSNDTDQEGRTIVYNWAGPWTHWGGAEWVWQVFCGTKPTNVVALGDSTSTAGGTAVTPTGNQLADYLASTRLYPTYKKRIGDVRHAARISDLNRTTTTKPLQFSARTMGNTLLNIGAGGERPDLGLISGWNVAGIIKYDAEGRRIIFENARYIGAQRFNASALNYDSPTKRYFRNGDTYPPLAGVTPDDPFNYGDPPSHELEQAYTAYLLTGDYYYYHTLNARTAGYCGQEQSVAEGQGQNFTWFGDWSKGGQWLDHYAGHATPYRTNSQQTRTTAWGMRTTYMLALLCPDRFRTESLLSWDKAWSQTWVRRNWERFRNIVVASTQPGSTYNRFGPSAMRFLTDQGSGKGSYPIWQWGYVGQSMGFATVCGMGDANLATCLKWMGDWYVDVLNSREAHPDLTYFGAHVHFIEADGAFIDTIAKYYARRASRNPIHRTDNVDAQSARWARSGTATLSATGGGSITVTLPANMLSTSRAAWYIGKWFCQHAGGHYGPGAGQIIAVLAANQIRISTTVPGGATFSSTSLTSHGWSLPPPAMPDDNPGNNVMPVSDSHEAMVQEHYINIHRGAAAMLTQANAKPGMRKVYDYMNAYRPNTQANNEQHDMRPA